MIFASCSQGRGDHHRRHDAGQQPTILVTRNHVADDELHSFGLLRKHSVNSMVLSLTFSDD